jgi:hypothetical protein
MCWIGSQALSTGNDETLAILNAVYLGSEQTFAATRAEGGSAVVATFCQTSANDR